MSKDERARIRMKVDSLLDEIEYLMDENDSLWLMLDETKESDIAAKSLFEEELEKYMVDLLLTSEPVGDS